MTPTTYTPNGLIAINFNEWYTHGLLCNKRLNCNHGGNRSQAYYRTALQSALGQDRWQIRRKCVSHGSRLIGKRPDFAM